MTIVEGKEAPILQVDIHFFLITTIRNKNPKIGSKTENDQKWKRENGEGVTDRWVEI